MVSGPEPTFPLIVLRDTNPCHPDNGGIAGKRPGGGLLPFCDACGRMTPPSLGEACDDEPGCIMRPLGTVEHPSA